MAKYRVTLTPEERGELEHLVSAGKAAEALGQMSDTATWTVMGRPETFALAGTKTKAEFTQLLQGIGAVMPKGLRLTPKGITAEGDRVAGQGAPRPRHPAAVGAHRPIRPQIAPRR